jgi:hypothetical protein
MAPGRGLDPFVTRRFIVERGHGIHEGLFREPQPNQHLFDLPCGEQQSLANGLAVKAWV